jgi:hypothetical protein
MKIYHILTELRKLLLYIQVIYTYNNTNIHTTTLSYICTVHTYSRYSTNIMYVQTSYGRAVFMELLTQAVHNECISFANTTIVEESFASTSPSPLSLTRIMRDHRGLSHDQQLLLTELTSTYHACCDDKSIHAFFNEAMTETSAMTIRQVSNALATVGIMRSAEYIRNVTGQISLSRDDCLSLVLFVKRDAIGRIHDLKNNVIIVSSQAPRDRYRAPVSTRTRTIVLD